MKEDRELKIYKRGFRDLNRARRVFVEEYYFSKKPIKAEEILENLLEMLETIEYNTYKKLDRNEVLK